MFQLDQLQTLATVAEEGTFEAAAQRLRVTASAVSQRIKAMEQSAGQVLLQRTNPVVPTEAGNVVLLYARQLQLLQADATTSLRALEPTDGSLVSISVAVGADALATWFLDALADVPASVGVVFDIHREDEQHTTELLRSGTVMAAVTSTAESVQGCSSEPLGIMRYRAVCSPAYAERWLDGVPELARAAHSPVMRFDRKDQLQHRHYRDRVGSELFAPRHYVPTSADFARAIVLGFGWGLLPEQQCSTELRSGQLLDLDPSHPQDVTLYWQRWRLTSPVLDSVTAAVRSRASRSLHPAA